MAPVYHGTRRRESTRGLGDLSGGRPAPTLVSGLGTETEKRMWARTELRLDSEETGPKVFIPGPEEGLKLALGRLGRVASGSGVWPGGHDWIACVETWDLDRRLPSARGHWQNLFKMEPARSRRGAALAATPGEARWDGDVKEEEGVGVFGVLKPSCAPCSGPLTAL